MKIGTLQFSPQIGNLEANINKIASFNIQNQKLDLLVLPELANSGYNFENKEEAYQCSEVVQSSKFVDHLQRLCVGSSLHIVTGFNERSDDKLYNSALLINSSGVIGKYRKLHLFLNEKNIFQPGNLGLPVFEVQGVKIGILICFDWIFAEAWRLLALQGADIICHPSNLVLPGYCQKGVPFHAMSNRIFILTANRTGSERNLQFTGNSIIVDPKGNILSQANATDEIIISAAIDIEEAKNKQITALNHIHEDRRKDVYGINFEGYSF